VTAQYQVRMGMSVAEGEALADIVLRCPEDVAARVADQLWLRTVLIEQQRRMLLDERGRFAVRADRILAALDPQEET
jgi:hypothetical protein